MRVDTESERLFDPKVLIAPERYPSKQFVSDSTGIRIECAYGDGMLVGALRSFKWCFCFDKVRSVDEGNLSLVHHFCPFTRHPPASSPPFLLL
jgi:hypothetical protein